MIFSFAKKIFTLLSVTLELKSISEKKNVNYCQGKRAEGCGNTALVKLAVAIDS